MYISASEHWETMIPEPEVLTTYPPKKRKPKKRPVRRPKARKRKTSKKTSRPRKDRQNGQVITPPRPKGFRPVKTSTTSQDREAQLKKRQKDQKEWTAQYRRETSKTARDIAPLPVGLIDWDRRLSCKESLRLFSETYAAPVFYKGWSDDQLTVIHEVEVVMSKGGKRTIAMPRAGGKTAICRSALIWGTGYAKIRFPFFIGSTQPKSLQTLEFIKTYWYRNRFLRQDFPEVGYPVWKLENRFHLARGQTYNGESTHIEYGADTLRYPCLMLPDEVADVYLKNDPDAVQWVKDFDCWIPRTSGIVIRTAGIDGSIRGEAEVHPITLEQPRPDFVLLDDVQKDQKAESPASIAKLLRLLDGAVQGLSGPGETIAALMPCTVIQEDDVSDVYLDRRVKPEWKGLRCSLVTSWPDGITDYEMGMDTPGGKLWNEYAEEQKKSLTLYDDGRLATEFYRKNRKEMDRGFTVSWSERYTEGVDLSAQQHAMNLRLAGPLTFPAEYQNRPKKRLGLQGLLITAKQLREKMVSLNRLKLPQDAQRSVAFIDVQNEILFYTILSVSLDFTGIVVDYGTFPEVPMRYFRKSQVDEWSLLTKLFFDAYPQHQDKALTTEGGKIRAPLEAKIYHALSKGLEYLMKKRLVRSNQVMDPVELDKIGIDTRWGQASDVCKRFCREGGYRNVVPCMGQAVPPTHHQFEEYTRTKGWIFEDQLHPHVKEVKWILKPDKAGQYHLYTDVSRTKSWLMARLASPLGSPGSISMFQHPDHEMFADHVCESEYPEELTARGITKEIWNARDGRPDNDFLDCLVGCCSLAGLSGASLKTQGKTTVIRRKKKLSDHYQSKRKG